MPHDVRMASHDVREPLWGVRMAPHGKNAKNRTIFHWILPKGGGCLLYTSDAADEMSEV